MVPHKTTLIIAYGAPLQRLAVLPADERDFHTGNRDAVLVDEPHFERAATIESKSQRTGWRRERNRIQSWCVIIRGCDNRRGLVSRIANDESESPVRIDGARFNVTRVAASIEHNRGIGNRCAIANDASHDLDVWVERDSRIRAKKISGGQLFVKGRVKFRMPDFKTNVRKRFALGTPDPFSLAVGF